MSHRVQKAWGKGVIGATTHDGDAIAKVFGIMTHDNPMFFTDTEKRLQTKAYEIPESSRTAKWEAIVNFPSDVAGRTHYGAYRLQQR